MNNPFFVLTDDNDANEIIGVIHNEPLQPPPGEGEDPDYLKIRIHSAICSRYDYEPKLITIPAEWKDMHKPIPVIVDILNEDKKEETLNLTLTIAWGY